MMRMPAYGQKSHRTKMSGPSVFNRPSYRESRNTNQRSLIGPSYWRDGVLLYLSPKLLSKQHASGALLLVAEGLNHSSIF